MFRCKSTSVGVDLAFRCRRDVFEWKGVGLESFQNDTSLSHDIAPSLQQIKYFASWLLPPLTYSSFQTIAPHFLHVADSGSKKNGGLFFCEIKLWGKNPQCSINKNLIKYSQDRRVQTCIEHTQFDFSKEKKKMEVLVCIFSTIYYLKSFSKYNCQGRPLSRMTRAQAQGPNPGGLNFFPALYTLCD